MDAEHPLDCGHVCDTPHPQHHPNCGIAGDGCHCDNVCADCCERCPPVRLCCGERHYGVECPDGLVMCCLCFDRVTKDRLALDATGARIDVCVGCDAKECREDP